MKEIARCTNKMYDDAVVVSLWWPGGYRLGESRRQRCSLHLVPFLGTATRSGCTIFNIGGCRRANMDQLLSRGSNDENVVVKLGSSCLR